MPHRMVCILSVLHVTITVYTVQCTHSRSMETEAKANRRRCFMGENCRAHASIQTV